MSNLTEAIAAAERLFPSLESIPAYLRTADINAAIVVSRALVSVAYDPLQLVKPLEWVERPRPNSIWALIESQTPVGLYQISWRQYSQEEDKEYHWFVARGKADCVEVPSLEAGKSACELDYRDRLRGIFK